MELTLNRAVLDIPPIGIRAFADLARSTPGAVSLTIGEPDLNTPEAVKEAAKRALDANDTHYPEGNGNLYLRQAIAAFERRRNGLAYDPEEIIVTIGATGALFAGLFTILNPGDEVIIPTPAFSLYEAIVRLCRGVPVALPTENDRFQVDPDKLRRALTAKTKAVILTSPNNPTGCVYTQETLEGLHRVLKDQPVFVLCDEVYRQLTYTDSFRSFSAYQDMHDRILVVQSFSKPYAMTGWRVGYLMADAAVRERAQMVHQYGVVAAPSFIQPACAEALNYDNSADVALFRRRRDYVYSRLTEMGLPVEKPEGAFYVFAGISQFGMDSLTFCTRMVREGLVAAVPGCYFGTEGYMRISYCYGDDELRDGLNRIQRFIRSL
ncbi:MAG: pyridoxal phosphate-dependent aminotransferase [Oscillibacter sp.]|jgi:aminotransferase|nr:pyridoxal phosphate-dependent aminotransferase [Oscillibacter sp.]